MPTINLPISDTFLLRDNANAALTGKVAGDFQVLEAYVLPGAATTAAVTLNEIGGGEYGAFNLDLGAGPPKSLVAGTWADVTYNGSAWVLTAAGSL